MRKNDLITIMFLSFVIFGALLSGGIIFYAIFFYHPEGWQESISLALQLLSGTGGLLLFVRQFQRIIDKRIESGYYDNNQEIANYISGELNDYIKKRMDSLSITDNGQLFPQVAMAACLSFLLSFLRKREPLADYEISIFCNKAEPNILCYVDSDGRTTASSHAYRQLNPTYYKEKNYQAVKYLEDETESVGYSVDIVRYEDNENYQLVTDRQRTRIADQIFHRFSVQDPHVLVIACNKQNIFQEKDLELKQVISTFGLLLNSELVLKAKFCCVNAMNCQSCAK